MAVLRNLVNALHLDPTIKPVTDWRDAEMDECTDDYVAYVKQALAEVCKTTPEPLVGIEQRLDFSHIGRTS